MHAHGHTLTREGTQSGADILFMCVQRQKKWIHGKHFEIPFYLYVPTTGFIHWDITFSKLFFPNWSCRDSSRLRWTNTRLRTFKLTAVTGKDRKLTAFMLWGNQRKRKHEQKEQTHTH